MQIGVLSGYRPPRSRGARDTTPVILHSGPAALSIAVTGGVPGAPVGFPAFDLTNLLGVPIEVNELHFIVDETADAVTPGVLAMGAEIMLALGRHTIASGVPVAALAVRYESVVGEGSRTLGARLARPVRWILPRPLIVGPGEGFSGAFRMNSTTLAPYGRDGTVGLSFAAIGRRLPAGARVPRRRAIPYATGYMIDTANVPPPESVLKNPFGVPFHVQSINASPRPQGTITIQGPAGLAGGGRRNLTAASAMGVFAARFAIEEPHDLAPGEFYFVTLDTPAPSAGQPGTAIVLSGWREEA